MKYVALRRQIKRLNRDGVVAVGGLSEGVGTKRKGRIVKRVSDGCDGVRDHIERVDGAGAHRQCEADCLQDFARRPVGVELVKSALDDYLIGPHEGGI